MIVVFRAVLDFLVPQACWGCTAQVKGQTMLCLDCFIGLARPLNSCYRCGQQVAQSAEACGHCLSDPCAQDRTVVAFLYVGIIATKLKTIKYGRAPQLSGALADLFLQELEPSFDFTGFNNSTSIWVVPVPTPKHKLQQRGFNPAGQIARQLSKAINARFMPRLLTKSNQAPSQVGSTRAKRKQQLSGTIKCKPPPHIVANTSTPTPAVLLIDDVLTTGSTLNTCAKALRRAGFNHIVAAAVAITP